MTARAEAPDPAADEVRLLAAVTGHVKAVLASVVAVGRAMARTAEQVAGARPLRRSDLAAVRPVVAGLLRDHRGLAAGAGVVLAPDVLQDAPRWIDWWWAGPRGALRPLDVDLDPASAEYYDYTTTEWYRGPARTGRPWVTGPYVDYICTHQYTFTLSAAVVHDGRFLGVAGADVLAAAVERLALPGLARLGRPAALVSANGRVIASNSHELAPGAVFPDSARPGLPDSVIGWRLMAGEPPQRG